MPSPRLKWRVLVQPDAVDAARRAAYAQRSSVVVVLGLCAGVLTALVAGELPTRTAPLALLVVLGSTLLAGRLAPMGPALAHGACAWAVLAFTAVVTHRITSAWHGIPALLLVLLLVEDMALIGRVGYVRHLIDQQRSQRTQPGT
jgi:hypothetical protein